MSCLSRLALIAAFALTSSALSCFAGEVKTGSNNANKAGEKSPHSETNPQSRSKPAKAPIDVSAETTFLVGPLTDDGRVDYVAAFNERWRKGVTPENNAVVPFLQAIGLSPLKEEVRAQYVKLLGIEAPPAEGKYFVSLGDFVKRQQPGLSRDEELEYYDRLEEARTKPWNPDEYPVLAAWFEENREPLDMMVQGTQRPRFYSPLVGEHSMGAVAYDVNTSVREVARALPARAMLRLQTEGVEAAWGDLMACLRLARHHIQASTVVQLLIGNAVQGMACDSARVLASYATLTPDQLRQIQNDLDELGPVSLNDNLLAFERCTMLEYVARWSCQGLSETEFEIWAGLDRLFNSERPINWNRAAREMNRNLDRLPTILARPCVEEQVSAFKKFEREISRRLWGKREEPIDYWMDFEALAKHVMEGKTPEKRARRFAAWFVHLFTSPLENVLWACGRASDDLQLTRISFALAGYRSDHKTYPMELSDLCPRYIDAIGKTRVAESDFRYRRTGDGFTASNSVPGSPVSPESIIRSAVAFDRKNVRQAVARLTQSGWDIKGESAESEEAKVRDEDIFLLASLPTLEYVWIDRASGVTDAGLAHLSDMPRLTTPDLL